MDLTGLTERILERLHAVTTEQTLTDLYNETEASSIEALANALGLLLERKEVLQFFRIVGSTGETLGDFQDPSDIPPSMTDASGRTFRPTYADMQVVYKASNNENLEDRNVKG